MKRGDLNTIQWCVTTLIDGELTRPRLPADSGDDLTVIIWGSGVWVYTEESTAFAVFRRLVNQRQIPNIITRVPPDVLIELMPRIRKYSGVNWEGPLQIIPPTSG